MGRGRAANADHHVGGVTVAPELSVARIDVPGKAASGVGHQHRRVLGPADLLEIRGHLLRGSSRSDGSSNIKLVSRSSACLSSSSCAASPGAAARTRTCGQGFDGETAQGLCGEAGRAEVIADLYHAESETIKRLVASRARAPEAVLEDACQTAWERLCCHPEVNLQRDAAMRWLVLTAIRQAWREARGESLAAPSPGELPDPASESPSPLDVAITREHSRALVSRLDRLSARERRFLALRAAGLSYREISGLTGTPVRTVERQIMGGQRKLRDEAEDVASSVGEGGEARPHAALMSMRSSNPRPAGPRLGLAR